MSKSATVTVESTASALAQVWGDDTGRIFNRGKVIAAAVAAKLSLADIAAATATARVKLAYPDATGDDLVKLAADPKFRVSKGGVGAYSLAWTSVQDSGLSPDAASFGAMFALVSRGRTSDARKALVAAAQECKTADEKREAIVTGAALAVRAVALAGKTPVTPPADSDESGEQVESDPVEVIVSLLAGLSDDALATVRDAIASEYEKRDALAALATA